ncbi:Protein CBG18415 [Caenorhabditis briggsae]|uniref:Serpentine receptor class gamma n=1 Tax=Caenorhabditis briggsae TaxID=6238 RepID=A8XT97_CAEBR|nr:Protein CBG18415 [Caenorhabditis briggsae]CAP35874.2 Protein CBG18415 [Caenorhabditis briggsae]
MAFMQYGMTTIITLNRLTVLLNFTFFEPIWKKYSWLLVIFLIFLPFLSTKVALNYDSKFSYQNSTDYFLLTSGMPVWEIYSILIPFMIVTIVTSLAANLSSFVFVKHRKLVMAYKADAQKTTTNVQEEFSCYRGYCSFQKSICIN